MQNYIICEKKGNLPRINVKICEHRCNHSKVCQAFQDFMKANTSEKTLMKPVAGNRENEFDKFPDVGFVLSDALG